MPNPDFQIEAQDDTVIVSGRLDFTTASQALQAVNEQLQQPGTAQQEPQVIDLGGVTHSNSAALALMIEWLAQARRDKRSVRFQNIPDSLRQISTVCQVDSLI